MKRRPQKTKVLFRFVKYPDGVREVLALFPREAGDMNPATCSCYAQCGQHSTADLAGMIAQSRPATAAESRPLLRELRRIGYKLDVRKRATYADYVERCRQLSR